MSAERRHAGFAVWRCVAVFAKNNWGLSVTPSLHVQFDSSAPFLCLFASRIALLEFSRGNIRNLWRGTRGGSIKKNENFTVVPARACSDSVRSSEVRLLTCPLAEMVAGAATTREEVSLKDGDVDTRVFCTGKCTAESLLVFFVYALVVFGCTLLARFTTWSLAVATVVPASILFTFVLWVSRAGEGHGHGNIV